MKTQVVFLFLVFLIASCTSLDQDEYAGITYDENVLSRNSDIPIVDVVQGLVITFWIRSQRKECEGGLGICNVQVIPDGLISGGGDTESMTVLDEDQHYLYILSDLESTGESFDVSEGIQIPFNVNGEIEFVNISSQDYYFEVEGQDFIYPSGGISGRVLLSVE